MKEYTIDFSKYNYEQLVDAFERVDDELYPQNALEIYQRILAHLNIDYKDATAESLGYEGETTVGWLLGGLFRNPFFMIMSAEDELIRRNMRERISRLNLLIAQS